MANLFWGVSDALDLYDEYINAQKQKVQKLQTSQNIIDAKTDINQKTENENENEATNCNNSRSLNISSEDIKTADVSKDCQQIGEKCKDENGDIEVTVEKNYSCILNTDNDSKGLTLSNNIESSQKFIEDKPKAENAVQNTEKIGSAQSDRQNKETHIEGFAIGVRDNEDSNLKSFEVEQTVQEIENCGKSNEISDENARIVRNSAVEIENNAEFEITVSTETKIDRIATKQDGNFDDESLDKETKLEYKIENGSTQSNKNEVEKVKDNGLNQDVNSNDSNFSNLKINNDAIPTTERQNAGEELNSDNNIPKSNISNQETFEEPKPRVLNILIFGGGDPRHIIKTMAKRYTHRQNEGTASSIPILKFYVIEGCMEIVARNIVLLGIALEKPEIISLRNKVHLFMDVYGNSLLRPICHQYLVSKAITLLKMVSDKETLQKIAPFIHIDDLKYREIDALQDAFEFWQPKPGYDFKIKDYWMGRIRQLLAVRYDTRDGVFDWDLNMSLKDRGGQQICSQEYRYWRETGIAFTFPEYEQSKPNKTLSAGLVRNGDRYLHRGYIGDIQTGPFCTFGLRSMEERMHHSAHGENDYRATDVTERNLLEYFHEIQSGTSYVHNNALSHKYGGVRFQMGERLTHDECDMKNICAYDQPWINVEGIEVHFLPLHEVKKISTGVSQWENFFDIAFVGYKFFEFLKDDFPKVLRENGLLILETKLRSVEVKNRITEFETELHGFARDANLLSVLNYNALNSKNSILKFWKPEKSALTNLKKFH